VFLRTHRIRNQYAIFVLADGFFATFYKARNVFLNRNLFDNHVRVLADKAEAVTQ